MSAFLWLLQKHRYFQVLKTNFLFSEWTKEKITCWKDTNEAGVLAVSNFSIFSDKYEFTGEHLYFTFYTIDTLFKSWLDIQDKTKMSECGWVFSFPKLSSVSFVKSYERGTVRHKIGMKIRRLTLKSFDDLEQVVKHSPISSQFLIKSCTTYPETANLYSIIWEQKTEIKIWDSKSLFSWNRTISFFLSTILSLHLSKLNLIFISDVCLHWGERRGGGGGGGGGGFNEERTFTYVLTDHY